MSKGGDEVPKVFWMQNKFYFNYILGNLGLTNDFVIASYREVRGLFDELYFLQKTTV